MTSQMWNLDLEALPTEVAERIEAVMRGETVAVVRGCEELGTLGFTSAVLEGDLVPMSRLGQPAVKVPEGITVVVTAMALSMAARRRLAEEFGEDYMVLDLVDAPADADILLTHPISLQLLGALRARFPRARVIITEIDDEEAGVNYSGPVSRLLDAGAEAYLPPRSLRGVAAAIDAQVRMRTELAGSGHSEGRYIRSGSRYRAIDGVAEHDQSGPNDSPR